MLADRFSASSIIFLLKIMLGFFEYVFFWRETFEISFNHPKLKGTFLKKNILKKYAVVVRIMPHKFSVDDLRKTESFQEKKLTKMQFFTVFLFR